MVRTTYFLPFLIGMSYLIYKKAQFNVSDPFTFTFNLNNNLSQDKLLTAYICLSARLIKSDTREAGEKVLYMNKYFSQHFPNQRDGFTDLLTDAYREEIDYMALLKWLNIKLPAHKDRFFNESMEQQKIAEERFLHIQKAYEILEILKKTN